LHTFQSNGSPPREGSFAHICTNTFFKEYQPFKMDFILKCCPPSIDSFTSLKAAVGLFENNLFSFQRSPALFYTRGLCKMMPLYARNIIFEKYWFARHILEDFALKNFKVHA